MMEAFASRKSTKATNPGLHTLTESQLLNICQHAPGQHSQQLGAGVLAGEGHLGRAPAACITQELQIDLPARDLPNQCVSWQAILLGFAFPSLFQNSHSIGKHRTNNSQHFNQND